MFAILFALAIVAILVLSFLRWDAASDRDFYRREYNNAWNMIGKYTEKERLATIAARERTSHDKRIGEVLRAKDEAIAKLRGESDHNFAEGLAAQMELGKMRGHLRVALFGVDEVPVYDSRTPPKGWDVLKVVN